MNDSSPVVVVTGASGGLGQAIALSCGTLGWRVLIHYHENRVEAESVERRILAAGADCFVRQADLRDPDASQQLVRDVIRRWGRIDVVISTAGVIHDRLLVVMPDADWEHVIAVNLTAAFHLLKAVTPIMIEQGGGVILNVASLAGLQGRKGQANYAAAKSGVIALTRSAALELAPYGIRVNAACPPVVDTAMTRRRASTLRLQQLLPSDMDVDRAAQAVLGALVLPGISGHTFILDHRIPEGTL